MALPYLRLSAFYFFYFSTLGAILPYWTLYLRELGLPPEKIGRLQAALSATKLLAPYLLGALTDRTGRRLFWIRLATFLAAAAFLGFFWARGFWELLAAMVGFGLFWSATLSQFEAVTVGYLRDHPERYPWVRLWGSLGFIASVLGLGWFLERFQIALLPAAIALQLWLVFLAALLVPEPPSEPASSKERGRLRFGGEALLFFAVVFLVQLSHAPYYVFFSPYLEDHGYPKRWIGLLWTEGVLAEILFFLLLPLKRGGFSPIALLLSGTLLGAVRWLVIGWQVAQLPWLLSAQLLHAATFGAVHAGAQLYIRRRFPDRLQGRVQALYSTLGFGLGGTVGSELSGQLWAALPPAWVYTLAALVMLLAALLVLLLGIASRAKLR